MIKVLFVCMGNICRSPMAEAVFQDKVNRAGLSGEIMVDSAGTSGWHSGEAPHPGTQTVLRLHNISYSGRSRQIEYRDLKDFDYVLAMDKENLGYILRFASGARAKIRLFLSFAIEAGLVDIDEVPDPYFDDNFEYVYTLVDRGCDAFLEHLRQTEAV